MIDEARESAGASRRAQTTGSDRGGGTDPGQGARSERDRARAHDEAIETRTRPTGGRDDGESDRQSFDAGRSAPSAGGSGRSSLRLDQEQAHEDQKGSRQIARELLRASFTDGQLDRGRIASLVDSID